MSLRYLFGPVSAEWADEYLPLERQSGNCVCFDTQAPANLIVVPGDTWDTLRARLPDGWAPDAIVLFMQYRSIPSVIWSAPLPVIALAGDWNLQWHGYRRLLRHADLVLTDTPGVEVMRREGIEHAQAMNLFGLGRSWLEYPWRDDERPIDVLFVGNFHPAVQRRRLPLLARLAGLRPAWNVVITSGVFGDEYRQLLARSRIVFNRSIRGECNNRAAEAIAAGALLFQEADNREVPSLLSDREECILYDEDNLEVLLEHYLRCEDERRAIAGRARQRLHELTFAHQWEGQRASLEAELPILRERAAKRREANELPDVRTRLWVQLSSTPGSDAALPQDVMQALHGGRVMLICTTRPACSRRRATTDRQRTRFRKPGAAIRAMSWPG